jgi:hypothetical protein
MTWPPIIGFTVDKLQETGIRCQDREAEAERMTYVRNGQGFYLDRDGRVLPPHRTKDPQWLAAHGVVDEDLSEIINQWKQFRGQFRQEYLW